MAGNSREIQHTAIVVKAADYKESDKMVRLFTLDGGIVKAVLKGVKKPGAKLKFAAQPFAFCEFSLVEKNGFYTVTGAAPVESFYALASDPDSFIASSLMVEAVDCAVSNLSSPAVFVYLLKLFKAVLYRDASPYAAAALLIAQLTESAGYGKAGVRGQGSGDSGRWTADGGQLKKEGLIAADKPLTVHRPPSTVNLLACLTPETLPAASFNSDCIPLLKQAIREFERHLDVTLLSARLIGQGL